MKRLRLLINVGLLGGMIAVASCSEDVIINQGIGGENLSPDNKELSEYNVIASIKQPELISRANIQADGKYVWNTGDVITLWNRNFGKGYDFTITSSYNDAEASSSADFNGKAYFENANKIVALYPKMESVKFNDWGTISLPTLHTQTTGNAELGASTYMIATGKFSEGKISDMEFSPLTALINFNMTNVSDRTLKLYEVTLEADKEVFPTEIKVNESTDITSYSGLSKTLTLNLGEQELASQATLKGVVNTLPTAYGDTRLISDNTNFSLSVKVWNGTSEQIIKVFNNVTIDELNEVLGFDASTTANQFKAGCQYNMNFDLEYRTIVPAEGYIVDDFGNFHIYNITGLYEWNKIAANNQQANVTLETTTENIVFTDDTADKKFDIENKEINLSGQGEWSPISIIYGTFEGNGFTIKNINIKEKGFIENNSGTIQNLKFDSPTVNNLNQSTGTVVMTNSGILSNCHVSNAEWTVTGTSTSYIGILAAEIGNKAITQDCSVANSNITSNNAASVAGLIGKNAQGTVINSFVNNVTINTGNQSISNTPDFGGLVGYLDRGFIKACYAITNITVHTPGNTGGLTGRVNGGTVLASYTSGSVTCNYNNGTWQSTAGFIGKIASGKAIGCYTTATVTHTSNNNTAIFCGTNSGEIKEAYYTAETIKDEEASKVSVSELANNARTMNIAVKGIDAKIGYGFFKNEDSSTNTTQPLILRPFDGNIPGFGGSDFGDGGDI